MHAEPLHECGEPRDGIERGVEQEIGEMDLQVHGLPSSPLRLQGFDRREHPLEADPAARRLMGRRIASGQRKGDDIDPAFDDPAGLVPVQVQAAGRGRHLAARTACERGEGEELRVQQRLSPALQVHAQASA